MGTRGRTQGDEHESTPAMNAARSDTSPMNATVASAASWCQLSGKMAIAAERFTPRGKIVNIMSTPEVTRLAISPRERLYRTEAVVLTRFDFKEADRIVTLYTPWYGKLRAIAKGVRRPKSRLGPHLDFFARCEVMLAKGRELDTVTAVETIDAYSELRTDLDAFGHASHMVELVNRLTEDRQENAPLYELLRRSLRLLADGVDPFAATRHFELALLTLLGYRPELYRCVSCASELSAIPNAFSVRQSGMLCSLCRPSDASSLPLSVNAQKYMRTLDRTGLATAVRLRPDEALKGEVDAVHSSYLRQVCERNLESLGVWRAVRRSTPVEGSSGQ